MAISRQLSLQPALPWAGILLSCRLISAAAADLCELSCTPLRPLPFISIVSFKCRLIET